MYQQRNALDFIFSTQEESAVVLLVSHILCHQRKRLLHNLSNPTNPNGDVLSWICTTTGTRHARFCQRFAGVIRSLCIELAVMQTHAVCERTTVSSLLLMSRSTIALGLDCGCSSLSQLFVKQSDPWEYCSVLHCDVLNEKICQKNKHPVRSSICMKDAHGVHKCDPRWCLLRIECSNVLILLRCCRRRSS